MQIINKLKAESWNIAYRTLEEGTILKNRKDKFCVIKNPIRYWAADPFVFEKDEKTYLFAELFDYCTNKGVIGCTELTKSGILGWKVIIDEQWHLSYPFVFENNGELYLMPEMNDGRSLWIYKAENFPYLWKKEKVVLDNVRLVDTTLFLLEDCYIAFSQDNHQKPVAFRLNKQLCFDKYIDYKGENGLLVRPGGRFFTINNECYAVCQDCTQTYGGALIFYSTRITNERIELGDNCLHLLPSDIDLNTKIEKNGIHTYTATKEFEVIDVKTRRFSILNLVGRLLFHLRREHE